MPSLVTDPAGLSGQVLHVGQELAVGPEGGHDAPDSPRCRVARVEHDYYRNHKVHEHYRVEGARAGDSVPAWILERW